MGELEDRSMGVLGGIDSRNSTVATMLAGKQDVATFARESRAYLPKGGAEFLIRSFETFEEVMGWAWDALKEIRTRMRRQWTTAKDSKEIPLNKDDIFPLPVSQAAPLSLRCTVSALNDLSGYSPDVAEPDLTASKCVQNNLSRLIERFEIWDVPCPEVSFKRLFETRTLDYSGEEIKVAQRLNWVAVSQSLPDGVGRLRLEDFCRLGTLHYVQNFTDHLLPEDAIKVPRPPSVMVEPGEWDKVCKGLVEKNICEVWPVELLYHFKGVPLLNGLFAVGKGEFLGETETQRLIMNLTPVNSLCRSLKGDVCTLPGLAGFSGFLLEQDQVALLSSEDIKCFFYLFTIPVSWRPFMGFNRDVPEHLVPDCYKGRRCVLVSRVLPMGFLNSVSIAQHVHRNIVRWSATAVEPPVGGEGELRKDKGMSSAPSLFRVYLDNFDQIEKVDKATADLVAGTASAQVLRLRQDYTQMGLPRHPKKAVERQFKAEIQGALFDGREGFAMPKVSKVWQYAVLALELLQRGRCTLRELQVVCGGFVYFCMFRRPLLSSLNDVWAFMRKFSSGKQILTLPDPVKAELARFVLLIPLAQMEFRAQLCDQVSCSDASMFG